MSAKCTSIVRSHGRIPDRNRVEPTPRPGREPLHTCLVPSAPGPSSRKAFTHTWFPPCFPFQTCTDLTISRGSSSLNVTPDKKHDLGRTPCKRESLHRMLIHRPFDSGFADTAWSGTLVRGGESSKRWVYLVEYFRNCLRVICG